MDDVSAEGDEQSQGNTEETPDKPFLFKDVEVKEGNWKYESVKYVYENNIMEGISGTDRFEPDSSLTRAMFATVLYRMADSPTIAYTDRYSDVAAGKWYSDADKVH